MLSVLALFIGLGVATFGLLVMRNPMRLALLSPRTKDYYQRMLLDRLQRNQLRTVGMTMSFFGWVFFTGALRDLLKSWILDTVSDGMLGLLWMSFVAAFAFGVIHFIVQLVRGRGKKVFLDSFRMWGQGMELEPIAVDPAITPQVARETKTFTLIYCLLLALSLIVAFGIRWHEPAVLR
jgi:hypothetical protein